MSSGFSYTSDTSNEEGGLHLPMDHSSSYTFNAPSAEAVATPYELHNCLQPSQPGSSSSSRHQWSSSPSSPVQTPAGSSRYNQPAAAPRSYFDSHQGGSQTSDAAAFSSPIDQDVNEASSDATISRRGSIDAKTPRRKKNGQQRSPPRHRGPRGAAEPESGDEHHDEDDDEDDEDRSRARKDAPRRPDQPVQSYSHHSSRTTSTYSSSSSSASETSSDRDDDDDHVRSLTRQLAETAVGVREMSKQLGRARVKSTIRSVLIITKARDNELIKLTRELALWLMLTPRNGSDRGVVVYVDSQLRTSKRFDAEGIQRDHPELLQPVSGTSSSSSKGPSSSASASSRDSSNDSNNSESEGQLRYWTADMCSRFPHLFDFVVTLGGDGTVLFCSWLFQRIVPPVLPFALGSLGFLTNFDFSDHAKVMDSAIDQGIRVNLRMRFTATVYRATLPSRNSSVVDKQRQRAIKSGRTGEIIMRNVREGGWERIEKPGGAACGTATDQPTSGAHKKDREVMCFSTRPVETFEVLNDLVVDRGPSPYVSLLEVFGDEHHMTTAQADGLCISTPTGSTAYSLSAGGSLVHPEIPAILITPICPHTLSFRPMLLPDSMELRIAVPYNSRSTAWASFDGRGRVELKQGDHIKVTASRYPFPTVCNETQSVDWFKSISRTLKWNERQRQKSFVVVEEGRSKSGEEKDAEEESKRKTKSRKQAEKGKKVGRKRTSSETGVSNQDGITDNGENVPMSKQEQRERSAVQRNAQGLADKDESLPLPNRLSGPAKVESINVDEPKPNGAAKTSEDEQEDDADEDEDEDDDDDDDEDEEDIEEAFDINDTSTVATRASSPQPMSNMSSSIGSLPAGKGSQHRHHHHHQLPRHGHKTDRSSHTHSAPGSHRASFDSLQRLAPFTAASNKSQGGSTSSQRGTISFDVPGGEGDRLHSRWPSNTSNSSKEDRVEQLNNESRASSTLNSPDRFSAAGPPDPPRALSKRHLADADFRLDGGKLLDDEQGGPGSQRQQTGASEQGKGKVKSKDSSEARTPDAMETSELLHHAEDAIKGATSLLNKPTSTAVRAGKSDSVTTDVPSSDNTTEQSRSSKSSRQRAERSTSSRRAKTGEESSSKSGAGESSGSGGTALVVYGEDSSSDSGSE